MYQYIIVIILFVSFLYYYSTRNFRYWKNKNVKGPQPIPFFGNYKDVALRTQHIGMLYSDLYKQFPDEKVVGLYRMTSPCLLIRDVDVIKEILVKHFEAFPDRGNYFSIEGLTQNIFHSDLETWKILRARFTTVFTNSKFKIIFHLLDDCSDKFVNFVEKVSTKQSEQDAYDLCLRFAVSSTMSTVYGIDVDMYNDDVNRFFQEVDNNFVATYDRELDMIFPGAVKKLNRSIFPKGAIEFCHQVIKTGLEQSANVHDMKNIMDVLSSMKKEGNIHTAKLINNGTEPFLEVTDCLLAAQVWITYLAGYGNSSLSLTYAVYHLACNPDVQDKLIKEIDETIEKHDGKFSHEMIKEMKYIEMVFEETLRMHPLTNAVQRRAAQRIKLEGLDFVIDKGTDIVISPYSVQHDEKIYPDPEKFDPERFSPENVMHRHQCAFLSFGAGRRSCLGSRLAQIQFAICIAKLLSKFRLETTKNTITCIKYDPLKLLLTPEERIYVRLVPREK